MNVLSLFDGISCGRVALDRAGIYYDNYYASEIDIYTMKVVRKNYPDTIQVGSIETLHSYPPYIDLIIGGSPCQGFSFAGKQLAFDDSRSQLFFEFVRILRAINPKYFLLENVKMKKEYQDIISSYLGVEPIEINSALVSAQNRKRLYWTNIPNVTQPEDKGILLKDILETGVVDRDKSYCLDASYWKGTTLEQYLTKSRRQIVFTERRTEEHILLDEQNKFRKLTPIECERLQTLPDNYTAGVSNTQRYKMLGNGWTVDILAHIFKGLNNDS